MRRILLFEAPIAIALVLLVLSLVAVPGADAAIDADPPFVFIDPGDAPAAAAAGAMSVDNPRLMLLSVAAADGHLRTARGFDLYRAYKVPWRSVERNA